MAFAGGVPVPCTTGRLRFLSVRVPYLVPGARYRQTVVRRLRWMIVSESNFMRRRYVDRAHETWKQETSAIMKLRTPSGSVMDWSNLLKLKQGEHILDWVYTHFVAIIQQVSKQSSTTTMESFVYKGEGNGLSLPSAKDAFDAIHKKHSAYNDR